MPTNIKNLQQFVANIKLNPIPLHCDSDTELVSNIKRNQKAQINAGALIGFSANLTNQNKNDVQDSFLLAQLAADAAYDRFSETQDWLRQMNTVLLGVGWNMSSSQYSNYGDLSMPVNWQKFSINVVAQVLSGSSIQLLVNTFKAAGKLKETSTPLKIWNEFTVNGSHGLFFTGVASAAANGDICLGGAHIGFRLYKKPGKFLVWDTLLDVNVSEPKIALNEDIYDQVRKQIIEKLGDRIKRYVAPI